MVLDYKEWEALFTDMTPPPLKKNNNEPNTGICQIQLSH